jgi:hypothetical protein
VENENVKKRYWDIKNFDFLHLVGKFGKQRIKSCALNGGYIECVDKFETDNNGPRPFIKYTIKTKVKAIDMRNIAFEILDVIDNELKLHMETVRD